MPLRHNFILENKKAEVEVLDNLQAKSLVIFIVCMVRDGEDSVMKKEWSVWLGELEHGIGMKIGMDNFHSNHFVRRISCQL